MTQMPEPHSAPPPIPHRGVLPTVPQGGVWKPPKPPKPPIAPRQRTSALIAGGVSFVLIGGGATALSLYTIAAAAVLAFAGTWQLALGAADEFGETADLLVSRGALASGIFIVACGLGYGASLLILRAGRVHRTNLTTLLASGIALTAWSAIAGVFVAVYLAATTPSRPWDDTPDIANQFLRVFIFALAIIACAAVGAFSWWLSAHLLRPRSDQRPVR